MLVVYLKKGRLVLLRATTCTLGVDEVRPVCICRWLKFVSLSLSLSRESRHRNLDWTPDGPKGQVWGKFLRTRIRISRVCRNDCLSLVAHTFLILKYTLQPSERLPNAVYCEIRNLPKVATCWWGSLNAGSPAIRICDHPPGS